MITPEQKLQIEATLKQSNYTPPTSGAPDWHTQVTAPALVAPPDTTNADKATFKATGTESPTMAALKTVGNIPKSAFNFGKGVIDFLNPLNAVKSAQALGTELGDINAPKVSVLDVAKEIPGTAYKMLVPQFLQHIFSGDIQKAAATMENDPVGQIAPLLFVARGVAEKAGKGAEFDTAMTKISSVVTKPVAKAISAAGTGASQVLGVTTGGGASSVKEGFVSASEGKPALTAFADAMRGKTEPTDIIKSAEDIVRNIKETRSSAYVDSLKKIGEDTKTHDITPVTTELPVQLDKFGIKVTADGLDFSRSSIANNSTARTDIQGVYDTIKSWGTQPGDRTGVGLDLLKKQLDDFYSPTSQGRAFVQALKTKVVGILNNEVAGYKDMTSNYAKTSALLDEIKSATGVGTKAKPDTVFTKLTTAMKGDKEFRLEVVKQMEQVDPYIMNKIAGINLSTWMPRGLVGKASDAGAAMSVLLGHFNPQIIPFLISTSPRMVGEFVRMAGIGATKASQLLNAVGSLKKLNVDVTGFISSLVKQIKETPNKQGGFVKNPLADQSANTAQRPNTTTANSSKDSMNGTIPQSTAKVNDFASFHPDDQKFLSDFAMKVNGKKPVTAADFKIAQETWAAEGYTVPKTKKELAALIATAEQSSFDKTIK